MLPGQPRRIVPPGKNEKFHLAGALDVRTGKLHTTGAAKKNAALFCELLHLVAAAYPRAKRIHLILDNYGIHSAHATTAVRAALRGRVVLHFLPPYCPDANRIERVWQDLHANVTRNHRCKNMNELLTKARRYLNAYAWRRLTGSAPAMFGPIGRVVAGSTPATGHHGGVRANWARSGRLDAGDPATPVGVRANWARSGQLDGGDPATTAAFRAN